MKLMKKLKDKKLSELESKYNKLENAYADLMGMYKEGLYKLIGIIEPKLQDTATVDLEEAVDIVEKYYNQYKSDSIAYEMLQGRLVEVGKEKIDTRYTDTNGVVTVVRPLKFECKQRRYARR